MRQADDDVLACAASVLSQGLVAMPGSVPVPGQAPPGACRIELLGARGQVLVPAAVGAAAGPVIPVGRRWLAAHLAQPITVPGAGAGGRWRVVITAVRYQLRRIPYVYGPDDVEYVIGGPAGHGLAGLAAVMAGLAGTDQISWRVAADYAAAAGGCSCCWPARRSPECGPSCGRCAGPRSSPVPPRKPQSGARRA